MATLHHSYNRIDELDSTISIVSAVFVMSLILALGYIYGLPEISKKNMESSLEKSIDIEAAQTQEITRYPEPGTLTH